jgi:hypothetical protein
VVGRCFFRIFFLVDDLIRPEYFFTFVRFYVISRFCMVYMVRCHELVISD